MGTPSHFSANSCKGGRGEGGGGANFVCSCLCFQWDEAFTKGCLLLEEFTPRDAFQFFFVDTINKE